MPTETYTILFLGDIVGRPGREAVMKHLPRLQREHKPTFTVVNGENSAAGFGITPDIADSLFDYNVDAITLGNHAYDKREIYDYLDRDKPIVRPHNLPPGNPGRGLCYVSRDGIALAVINMSGRIYMNGYDDPFSSIDALLETIETPHVFIDFHAEVTSEKVAYGYHCDGRVSAVVGSHTHVQTADESILSGGTAHITDVGMCGPIPSVIGMDKDIVLKKFRTSMPTRFEVANQPSVICGVLIDVKRDTGRATAIQRVRIKE